MYFLSLQIFSVSLQLHLQYNHSSNRDKAHKMQSPLTHRPLLLTDMGSKPSVLKFHFKIMKTYLIFRGPFSIVKYSYNKSQRDALFLKFI
jgi:hypothetical protein